jgi:hypothetical protein
MIGQNFRPLAPPDFPASDSSLISAPLDTQIDSLSSLKTQQLLSNLALGLC